MRRLIAAMVLVTLLVSSVPTTAAATDVPSILDEVQANLRADAATWYNDADGDKVFDTLEDQFVSTGAARLPTIVTFVHGTDAEQALGRAVGLGNFDVRYAYHAYGGFAADLSLDEALAIAAMPEVRQVEWSQPGQPELDTATEQMGVDAVQDLLGIDGSGALPDDLIGEGATVAILDTGFDGNHVDLQGKFIKFIDWSNNGAEGEPYDSGSHGTHVASIVAGLGVGDAKYVGVAPGADLVGFQITGGDTKANAIASIDWILANQNETPVDVLTISFGFGTTVDGTDALEIAMDKAWDAGVTNFKSTGNSGPERGTVTIPGGARGIIGTASLFDGKEGGFRLSEFSSRGPTQDGRLKPDIAAPGSSIMAANVGTGDGYTSKSGTSMASPFAAGVAALLKSIDSTLTPDQILEALASTAEDWGLPGHDIDYGHGRLDALAAVQKVLVERAAREQLPFDTIAAWNVTGPAIQPHIHGELNLANHIFEFDITDSATPLAITLLVNQTSGSGPLTYDIVVTLRDPDGIVIFSLGADPARNPASWLEVGVDPDFQDRQQTFSVIPGATGTFSLEMMGGGQTEEFLVDISAALDADPFVVPFPELSANSNSAASEASTPMVAPWLILAAIALATRRR